MFLLEGARVFSGGALEPPADCQLADLEIFVSNSAPDCQRARWAGYCFGIIRQYRPARTANTSRVMFA